MSCHSRTGVWLPYYQPQAKKWHLPVDGQLIQFLTHDEGFGVVIQPSAVGVRQLGTAGTSILAARISFTVTNDTRQPTLHRTILYCLPPTPHSWWPNPSPADTESWSPSAVSDTIKSPSPLFRFFIARRITKSHEWPCSRTGSGYRRRRIVFARQSGNRSRDSRTRPQQKNLWWHVKCDQPNSTSTIQTSLPKADCSYP